MAFWNRQKKEEEQNKPPEPLPLLAEYKIGGLEVGLYPYRDGFKIDIGNYFAGTAERQIRDMLIHKLKDYRCADGYSTSGAGVILILPHNNPDLPKPTETAIKNACVRLETDFPTTESLEQLDRLRKTQSSEVREMRTEQRTDHTAAKYLSSMQGYLESQGILLQPEQLEEVRNRFKKIARSSDKTDPFSKGWEI